MTKSTSTFTYRSASEFQTALTAHAIPRDALPDALMDIIDSTNVKEVMDTLSEEERDFVADWAVQEIFMRPAAPVPPPHPRKAVALAAMRYWLEHFPIFKVRYHNLSEFAAEIADGLLNAISVPSALLDFADDQNIDEAMDLLWPDARAFVIEWAKGVLDSPPEDLLYFGSVGATLYSTVPTPHPRKPLAMAALRGWLERHPEG